LPSPEIPAVLLPSWGRFRFALVTAKNIEARHRHLLYLKSKFSDCCSSEALQKFRKIIEVFALEPVRRPAARSFSEEGEIFSESLVRILMGLI
jgi:hypothetical protein